VIWALTKYFIIAVNALFLCCVLLFLVPKQRRHLADRTTQILWAMGAAVVLVSCLVQAMVEYGAPARLGMPVGPLIAVLLVSFVSRRWFSPDRGFSSPTPAR
jgi:Ca2+/H+ antiporter